MGDRDAKTALFEQFARVGKALGNGKRLELLDLLAQGPDEEPPLPDGYTCPAHRIREAWGAQAGRW